MVMHQMRAMTRHGASRDAFRARSSERWSRIPCEKIDDVACDKERAALRDSVAT